MQSYDLKINTLFDSLVESVTKEYINDKQNYPWIIGFSGGKDSSSHSKYKAKQEDQRYLYCIK